jgi:murein DD-endopeptidase MepM/ murein hydrolase activator NlpD
MSGPGILYIALFFASFPMSTAQRHSASPSEITFTPANVEAGSPELIRINAPGATQVTGEWLGRKVQFFESGDTKSWFALAGVDVEAPEGVSKLKITVHVGIDTADFDRDVVIHPAHYRTGKLTVAPKFVEPGPEEMKVIAADADLKKKVFGTSASEPLWRGDFRAPVLAPPTDSFGTRRMFNGKLASIHKGMDFRAPMGTVVRASNSGVVVLARPLYYEGNCVVIDHGLGVYTVSMHFSRIDVHEGQHVAAGDRLGLSGATGRVTGPHLHWAVRWEGAYLDPAKLLRLNLSGIR